MVGFNAELTSFMPRYHDYVIIVEGKRDLESMKALGFEKVHPIHVTGVPLRERAEQIRSLVSKKERVCILTDFDKKGKQLYLLLKKEFSEMGVKLDASLRGILLKSGISHIEGLSDYFFRRGY